MAEGQESLERGLYVGCGVCVYLVKGRTSGFSDA